MVCPSAQIVRSDPPVCTAFCVFGGPTDRARDTRPSRDGPDPERRRKGYAADRGLLRYRESPRVAPGQTTRTTPSINRPLDAQTTRGDLSLTMLGILRYKGKQGFRENTYLLRFLVGSPWRTGLPRTHPCGLGAVLLFSSAGGRGTSAHPQDAGNECLFLSFSSPVA